MVHVQRSAAGSLYDVGIRSTINEGSTTTGLQVGSDTSSRAKDRGEICLYDIVNLLNARSAKVDAAELGAVLAGNNGSGDRVEFGESQGTGGRLNDGKGLGDAELVVLGSIGKANGLPNSGINLLNEGDSFAGLGIAELCGATSGHVGDDKGKIVIGARSAPAEALQPGIDGGNDGAVGSLHENLDKIAGIETLGPRVSSDGKDGGLALGGNACLSECATDNRSDK
jgi:hypothetical protein